MAAQVTNYKCPACTGPLRFDGATGRLVCDFCGTVYEVADIEKMYEAREAAAAAAHAGGAPGTEGLFNAEEAEHLRAYSCPSCGAQLICDDTTVATSCPYCGNPTVVPGQIAGAQRPDLLVPFRLDKNAAKAALKSHYRRKAFLPKGFSDDNRVEEIQGVYVPFWLFDCEADATARFHATSKSTHRSGNEEVTVTEHYQADRGGTIMFQRIPVDASTKMPDAHMDAIEPYDYGDLKDFSTAYLPGFLADRYDVSAEAAAERADARIRESSKDALRSTVNGYQSVSLESAEVRIHRGPMSYALLPVWMLATRWEDSNFLFAMNGQTGKLIGDLPVDHKKFWLWFACLFAPLAAILGLALFLGNAFGDNGFWARLIVTLAVPLLIAFVTCMLLRSSMKTAVTQRAAANYIPPGGVQITHKNDWFVRREETRRTIQSQKSSNS